ncbi:MAG: hypothetical protein R3E95_00715 [Thiolinea sp.]
MSEKTVTRLMYALIILGLSLSALGVGLVIFTDIVVAQGVQGIALVSGLIAGGLFLSVPAKIYLTLQLMKMNDRHRRNERNAK